MHLYSNELSAIVTVPSSISLELFGVCFSCSITFNLSLISLGSVDKSFVDIPESMIEEELSNLIIDLSLPFLLPGAFRQSLFLF